MPEAPRPRQAIVNMAPYSPPTAGRAGKLRLDFNENTVGCSPQVIEFLRQRLDAGGLAVYPEYVEARKELAAFFRVSQDELLLTNGTDEAIQLLVHTYLDDGNEAIILRPSYAMYRFYCEIAGACIREIPYRPADLGFPLTELLNAIGPSTRLILLSNPNNPTGTATDLDGIIAILEKARRAAVLIDEAYYEFYGVTALEAGRRYPNLFVSRTFSKVYGMAAMRIGCLLTSADNAAWLRKAQSPYSVNALAALAARGAIRDTRYTKDYIEQVLAARAQLYAGFDRLGVSYFCSQANFVLFRAGDRARDIRDRLGEVNVLVRDRSYELPGCVRVTVGTPQQVQRFLDELERIW